MTGGTVKGVVITFVAITRAKGADCHGDVDCICEIAIRTEGPAATLKKYS